MSAAKPHPRTPRGAPKPAASPSPPPSAADARLEGILAQSPSPFSDAVLANAFRETPDVPSIHAAVRARCLALVRAAREEGRTSLQVVLGDAGEGKTHLISWLRRQSEEGWRRETPAGRFALTVVPPMRSLARARHHVLQEVVRQLSVRLPGDVHVDEATDTPIEILVWRALLAIAKILVARASTPADLRDHLREVTAEDPDRYLSLCVEGLKHAWKAVGGSFVDAASRIPELAEVDRDVFRVVARFPEGEEPERVAIVDWLGGASLSASRLESLGTQLVLDDEAEAARGLRTLLVLANLARTPVALAFDQIEGVTRLGPDAVSAFLDAIAELYNESPGTALLVFCQTQLWPTLRARAANHVRDRLEVDPALHLRALTPDEALLLVATRMRRFWDGVEDPPADPLFPLGRDAILADVARHALRTPRAVVKHFQALLALPPGERGTFEPAPPSPDVVVRRKLDALVEEERRTPRLPDLRVSIAQGVVADLLAHAAATGREIAGARVAEAAPFRARKTTGIEGVRVVLVRGDARRRVYLEGSNSQHGKSAASTVGRLAEVVASGQADVALLLREDAFPLPPAAKKAFVEMRPRGVKVALAEGEIATLAALESLLNAAAAGDLPVDRKTALDVAIEHLGAGLGIERLVVSAAFPAVAAAVTTTENAIPNAAPASARTPGPPSVDCEAPILAHLRTERAFESSTNLAAALRLPADTVAAALDALQKRGLVEIVSDRNRAPVALLLPEGLAT